MKGKIGKAHYDEAELEIVIFEISDIVTASTPAANSGWESGSIEGGGWDVN